MLQVTLLNSLKYFLQVKILEVEHIICEINSISINIIRFFWFMKQSKVVLEVMLMIGGISLRPL